MVFLRYYLSIQQICSIARPHRGSSCKGRGIYYAFGANALLKQAGLTEKRFFSTEKITCYFHVPPLAFS